MYIFIGTMNYEQKLDSGILYEAAFVIFLHKEFLTQGLTNIAQVNFIV